MILKRFIFAVVLAVGLPSASAIGQTGNFSFLQAVTARISSWLNIPHGATPPTTGQTVGNIYVDTDDYAVYIWNGSAWVTAGGGSGTIDGTVGPRQVAFGLYGSDPNTITSNTYVVIDANDPNHPRLGVGRAVPQVSLHVASGSAGADPSWAGATAIIEAVAGTWSELHLFSAANQGGSLCFSNTVATCNAAITYDQNAGLFDISVGVPGSILRAGASEISINDDGANADIRFEGDTNVNLFFLDASTDRIGLGTTTPSALLDVRGSAIFNEAGDDFDFRVEGDTNTNMLLVDASTDRVAIGTTAPASTLDIEGSLAVGATYSGTTAAPANGLIVQGVVGFGTAAPQAGSDLDIVGAANPTVVKVGSSGSNALLHSPANVYFQVDSDNNSTTQRFEVRKDAATTIGGTALLTVLESGYVGISLDTPLRSLDVNGTARVGTMASPPTYTAPDLLVVQQSDPNQNGLVNVTVGPARRGGLAVGDPNERLSTAFYGDMATRQSVIGSNNIDRMILDANNIEIKNTIGLTMPEQGSTPSTPASGKGIIYGHTDGKVYWKNDAGTATDLTAGSGASTVAQLTEGVSAPGTVADTSQIYAIDPDPNGGNDPNAMLMLHMDTPRLGDSSTNQHYPVRVGYPQKSKTTVKYGDGSAYLNGASAISFADSADFTITTNFTVDWWMYESGSSGGIVFAQAVSGSYSPINCQKSGTTLNCYLSSTGSSWNIANPASMGTVPANTWVHMAITWDGSNYKFFNAGALITTVASSTALMDSPNPLYIGSVQSGSWFTGYIDEFRLSKGIARWTAAFTPPTVQYKSSRPTLNVIDSAGNIKLLNGSVMP